MKAGLKTDISIIIPAFNESKRLPGFLGLISVYSSKSNYSCEVIVVDDGSTDNMVEEINSYKSKLNDFKIISVGKNIGKGNAVRLGLLRSKGDVGVFMDADGAVTPDEIEKNLHYLSEYDVFIGSRVLKGQGQVLKVKWHRKIIGTIFNLLIHIFLFKSIQDTQCGFKMFRKKTIEPIFSRAKLNGFGFDIEVLYIAKKLGFTVKEGPVSWHHVEGSKINLIFDSFKMFLNILQIKMTHRF